MNFLAHQDNADHLCRYHFPYDVLQSKLSDAVKSMNDYIIEHSMNKCGWGTNFSICYNATNKCCYLYYQWSQACMVKV